MNFVSTRRLLGFGLGMVVGAVSLPAAWAGGSGLNVAVVINQNSTNSRELGNYYCERRQVPPENVLRINWAGGNVDWTLADYTNTLLNPLAAMLAGRNLTNQIDYVVLSMGIPYRVTTAAEHSNATTAVLFYGFKPDTRDPYDCPLATNSENSYAHSEDIFRLAKPTTAGSNSFLTTMLTADTLAQAKSLVDQGVNSDGTFPAQTAFLAKTSDAARSVRFYSFDNAVFNARVRGNYSLQRTNSDSPAGLTNLLGYQTGLTTFSLANDSFVPGAMADNLTSYGGYLFDPKGQTTALAFTQAGAAASYGTVDEPCNYLEKFPDPQNYFYQARGFSLAECYYQSLANPYEGILVGEPLAAPFQTNGSLAWAGLPPDTTLQGATNLSLQLTATGTERPLQQVDLFLDGKFLQTVTNLPPCPGNIVNVSLNGFATNRIVLSNATIKSVASDLTSALNGLAPQTHVTAIAHGDRIELQSSDNTKTGAQVSVVAGSSVGSGAVLTTFINSSGGNFLDSIAWGYRQFRVSGSAPTNGDYLQLVVTKTNGAMVSVAVTNSGSAATINQLVQQLLDLVNAMPSLQTEDGVTGEDLDTFFTTTFNLRARSPGLRAAQIQAQLTGSTSFVIEPMTVMKLDENLSDLQPRHHLYLTAGTTNLLLSFPLNTATLADGFHELTAVAYEGSHVRTQTRAAVPVRIQNSSLSATLGSPDADSVTAVEAMFHFQVKANDTNVTRIELFTTGGLLAAVSSQASVSFTVDGPTLGLGLHRFYALVTRADGQVYRTPTFTLRLVGKETDLPLTIAGPNPLQLLWSAIAGRSYDVLTTDQLSGLFTLRTNLVPTNSGSYTWTDSLLPPGLAQRFYKVGVSP